MDTVTFSSCCELLRIYALEYLNLEIPDPVKIGRITIIIMENNIDKAAILIAESVATMVGGLRISLKNTENGCSSHLI
ncbi:MAG: hypothetical protein ACK5MK_04240 [Dysgonomonas sp.]